MESKKVKVILLPTGKDGWNKGDILKCTGESPAKHRKEHISLSIEGCEVYSNLTIMYKAHYMYLISDDEITKNNWCYDPESDNGLVKCMMNGIDSYYNKYGKLIIATNNPDLVADGVPRINALDLKWWVDNSCLEEVSLMMEEYDHYSGPFGTDCSLRLRLNLLNEVKFVKPKVPLKIDSDVSINHQKETVEEAAKKWITDYHGYDDEDKLLGLCISQFTPYFKAGAKWKENN